jgi:hypothetical protein
MTAQTPLDAAAAVGSPAPAVLSVEDAKLVTLARGAMARAGATQGAAVRDDDGRTYAAAAVSLPSLTLTAVQAAVVLAASSAASGLEAAVVIDASPAAGKAWFDEPSLAVLRNLGTPIVILTDATGAVLDRRRP